MIMIENLSYIRRDVDYFNCMWKESSKWGKRKYWGSNNKVSSNYLLTYDSTYSLWLHYEKTHFDKLDLPYIYIHIK